MEANCPQCVAKGLAILPLRHAVLPKQFKVDMAAGNDADLEWAPLPSTLESPAWANCAWKDMDLGDNAVSGLRSLRPGALYIYYPQPHTTIYKVEAQWEAYTVNRSGTFTLCPAASVTAPMPDDGKQNCSRCGSAAIQKLGHVVISNPEKCEQAYLAFSEKPWTSATRKKIEKNPGGRMQLIKPRELFESKGNGQVSSVSEAGFIKVDIESIQTALEWSSKVNSHILSKYSDEESFYSDGKPVPHDQPGRYMYELTADSRGNFEDERVKSRYGAHDPDILKNWSSSEPPRFRWPDQEADSKRFDTDAKSKKGEREIIKTIANNSLETPATQTGHQWAQILKADYIEPMKSRDPAGLHPGVLIALNDELGVGYDLNVYLTELEELNKRYHLERKAELFAMRAIRDLPASRALKYSLKPMSEQEFREREPAIKDGTRIIVVETPGGEISTGVSSVGIPTSSKWDAYKTYTVDQSAAEALEEAMRPGPMMEAIFDSKTTAEYNERVARASSSPYVNSELDERLPYIDPSANISITTITRTPEGSLADSVYTGKVGNIPPEVLDRLRQASRYYGNVSQPLDKALAEAKGEGPLKRRVLVDNTFNDRHDTVDTLEMIDYKLLFIFKENYTKFQAELKKMADRRGRVLVTWFDEERLFRVLEDCDQTNPADRAWLHSAVTGLLSGCCLSQEAVQYYWDALELKIPVRKNLVLKQLSFGDEAYEKDVITMLRDCLEKKDVQFDDAAQLDPWLKWMKAAPDFIRKQSAIHIGNFWTDPEKNKLSADGHTVAFRSGKTTPVPGTTIPPVEGETGPVKQTNVKAAAPAFNAWVFTNLETLIFNSTADNALTGSSRKGLGLRVIDRLGTKILWCFIMTAHGATAAEVKNELKKFTAAQFKKIREDLVNKGMSRSAAGSEANEIAKNSRHRFRKMTLEQKQRFLKGEEFAEFEQGATKSRIPGKKTGSAPSAPEIYAAEARARQYQLTSRGTALTSIFAMLEIARLGCIVVDGVDYRDTMKITSSITVLTSSIFELTSSYARYVELKNEIDQFSSQFYRRAKIGAGVFGSLAFGLAAWNDWNAIKSQKGEKDAHYTLLVFSCTLNSIQALTGLYVAATYSVTMGAGAVAVECGVFFAGRLIGMMLGPVGICLSILISVAIWATEKGELEKWARRCPFGRYRISDPDKCEYNPDELENSLSLALAMDGYIEAPQ